jgi:hypothetical protein
VGQSGGRAHILTPSSGRRSRYPLAGAVVLLAALIIAFTPACDGGEDSASTTAGDAQSRRKAIASDVAHETVRVFRRLGQMVRALQYFGPPVREQIIRRLGTVEKRAQRLARKATKLPDTASRRPLIALNRTAARTASSIRRVVRLSEKGQIEEARSIARIAAAELRHSIERLRGLAGSRLPGEGMSSQP